MSIDFGSNVEVRDMFIRAFRRSMAVIQNKVKRRTPVDKGLLRNSVTWDLQEISEDKIEFWIGSNVVYAPPIEFGFMQKRVTKDGRPYVISYAGAHMFRNGIDASRSSVDKIVKNTVTRAMKKSTFKFLKDFGAKIDF